MYLCIDFDGTIVEHAYPEIGKPVPYALDYIKAFQDTGAKIILWTMRSGDKLQEAVDYVRSNGVYLYGINQNPDQASWTQSPKAYGHIYIDDAAFGCPLTVPFGRPCRPYVDWSIVGQSILSKLAGGL